MALWLKRGIRSREGQMIWTIWKISSGNILKRSPLEKQLGPLGTNLLLEGCPYGPCEIRWLKKRPSPRWNVLDPRMFWRSHIGIDLYIHVRIHSISKMGRLNYICSAALLSIFEGSVIPDYLFSGTLPWNLVYGNGHIRYDHIHGNKSVVTSIPI